MGIITDNLGDIGHGLWLTVALTVVGYLGALVLGTLIAVCRVSPVAPLRALGAVYVEFFRNIPLLSLLILLVFGIPDVGILLPLLWAGALALMLSGAAFVCETVRSGINTVAIGQSEAARALGMSFTQQIAHVILPQALRTMVQPLVNVFIGTLLGSSLCAAVGVAEITNVTQQLNLQYSEAVLLFLVSGAFYLVLSLAGGYAGSRLERRFGSSAPRRPRPQDGAIG